VQNKKIVIIGDDIRQPTGVGNILRAISLELSQKYDIVQIAAGLDSSEVIDISESVSKATKNPKAYFKLYGTSEYGSLDLLRSVIRTESASAILIMTDPHRFNWLFEAEHEVRSLCPIYYYHVWDNTPYPKFLSSIYNSCDAIGCISKLTHECVTNVVTDHPCVKYTPHGINTKKFYPQDDKMISQNRKDFLGKDYEFVLFCNATNIQRKELSILMSGFNEFYNKLSKKNKEDVVLLIHTNPTAPNGVNINSILDDLYSDLPVLISDEMVLEPILNNMYNLSSCVINIASNEGFGLSTLEAVATKTPIIVNNTGGLKDQINEDWTEVVEPSVTCIRGTQQTPYIHADYVDPKSVGKSINTLYKRRKNIKMDSYLDFLRDNNFTEESMCSNISSQIDELIYNYKQPERFRFSKIT